jgi:hypothetical protein
MFEALKRFLDRIRGTSPPELPATKVEWTVVVHDVATLGTDPELNLSNGVRVMHCKPWSLFSIKELERTFVVFVPNWQNTEFECVMLECFPIQSDGGFNYRMQPLEDEAVHALGRAMYRCSQEQALQDQKSP